jgi:hypothetical protein
MKTAKVTALDFGSSLLEAVKLISIGMIELLNNTNNLINSLLKLKGLQGQSWGDWFKHIAGLTPGSGAKRDLLGMMQDKPLVPIKTDKTEKFFNDQINKLDILKREAAKPLEFGPPKNLMGPALDNLVPKVNDAKDAFKDLNDEINRKEPPKWEKFLADNLTPLQIYQNELKKLSALLDPTEGPNGLKAFAIGSAAAIKKLKDATGLGGPQQFASAVQAGSAAEFQVKVDEMGKAKNVQEEIRQLMEAAAEVEAQQLEAAREIAAAIDRLPAQMPRPQQIAVALNP